MLNDPEQGLSIDLEAFIPRSDASMIVVRMEGTHWTRRYAEDLELETGLITFRVLELLHGAAPEIISVTATRIADPLTRARNPIDPWNRLRLKTDDTLILACLPGQGSEQPWKALAAIQIDSPAAAEVAALREAYAIEQFIGSTQQRSRLLAEALESNQDLLQRYAMYQVAAKAAREREAAVRLLRGAIASPRTTADSKLELGLFITGSTFLVRECQANPGNQIVIGALANALVNEDEPGKRATWARILASAVTMEFCENPTDDNRVRSALIRSPECPPPDEVISILFQVAASSEGAENQIFMRLVTAWQSA